QGPTGKIKSAKKPLAAGQRFPTAHPGPQEGVAGGQTLPTVVMRREPLRHVICEFDHHVPPRLRAAAEGSTSPASSREILYPVHARIRKSLGEMTRKLSDTASQ